MNQQNQSNSGNSNNQSNYEGLSLQELKDLASKKEIIPEGNKSAKDTWIKALEEYDYLKSINKQNGNGSSENSPNVNNQQQIKDNLSEQKSSIEAQDYVLENIVTALDQRRVDVDRLEISLDGQNIFKMRDGDVARSTITDSQTELIKQALNDPASFKGSIKITNGRQVLLHVKDGQVLRDGLNLTKSSTKVEISSTPSDLYDKYSQGVESKGLQATKQVAVNALTDGVGQKQVKEIIKAKDLGYQSLATSAGKNSANSTLDKIVTSASAEVKNRNSLNKSERLKKSPALATRS